MMALISEETSVLGTDFMQELCDLISAPVLLNSGPVDVGRSEITLYIS